MALADRSLSRISIVCFRSAYVDLDRALDSCVESEAPSMEPLFLFRA